MSSSNRMSLLSLVVVVGLFSVNLTSAELTPTCPIGSIEGFVEDGTAACYLYQRFPAQYTVAEALCRSADGHLASINDLYVNDFVAQGGVEAFEVMRAEDFWIGAHDLLIAGQWNWTDVRTAFNFSNWSPGQPDLTDGQKRCVAMSLPEGKWRAVDCFLSKPYACALNGHGGGGNSSTPPSPPHGSTTTSRAARSTTTRRHRPTKTTKKGTTTTTTAKTTTPTTTTTQKPGDCESSWTYFDQTGLCYKIVDDHSDCAAVYKAEEATIHNTKTNTFIGGLAANHGKTNVKVRLSAERVFKVDADPRAAAAVGGAGAAVNATARMARHQPQPSNGADFERPSTDQTQGKTGWRWNNGQSFDFVNWADYYPIIFGVRTCLELNTCYKQWYDFPKNCQPSLWYDSGDENLWTTVDCYSVTKRGVCSKQPLKAAAAVISHHHQ